MGHINFHLAAKIWSHEKSDFYLEEFERCYDSLRESSMIAYINDAEKIDHQKTTSLFIKIIINSDQEYIRRYAAQKLLNRSNILDEFIKEEIIDNLSKKDMTEREKIIQKVKNSIII